MMPVYEGMVRLPKVSNPKIIQFTFLEIPIVTFYVTFEKNLR